MQSKRGTPAAVRSQERLSKSPSDAVSIIETPGVERFGGHDHARIAEMRGRDVLYPLQRTSHHQAGPSY